MAWAGFDMRVGVEGAKSFLEFAKDDSDVCSRCNIIRKVPMAEEEDTVQKRCLC